MSGADDVLDHIDHALDDYLGPDAMLDPGAG